MRELGGRRPEPLRSGPQLVRPRVDLGGRPQLGGGRAERVGGGAVRRQEPLRRGRPLQQALRVREPCLLDLQLLELPGPRARGLDLADLIGQQVELALPVALALRHGGPLRVDRAEPGVLVAKGGDRPRVGRPGEPIQEGRLGRRGQQPGALVLPVHLDEVRRELGQRGHRRELPADPRRAPALRRHRPREHQLAVLGPARPNGSLRRVEDRLDARRARPRPDQRDGGPPAERERQPDRHHRLAGPGLAGQHVETRMELEVELLDDPEAADVELGSTAGARTTVRPASRRSALALPVPAGQVELARARPRRTPARRRDARTAPAAARRRS